MKVNNTIHGMIISELIQGKDTTVANIPGYDADTGVYYDKNYEVIEGQVHIGHTYGHEFWRYRDEDKNKDLSKALKDLHGKSTNCVMRCSTFMR